MENNLPQSLDYIITLTNSQSFDLKNISHGVQKDSSNCSSAIEVET